MAFFRLPFPPDNLSYADGSAGPRPIEDLKRVLWHRQWVPQDYTGLPSN